MKFLFLFLLLGCSVSDKVSKEIPELEKPLKEAEKVIEDGNEIPPIVKKQSFTLWKKWKQLADSINHIEESFINSVISGDYHKKKLSRK